MSYRKPNIFCYRIAQCASWFVSTFIFRRKLQRNEIKGKKGPFVVIANHEAALDFVNLIGITSTPMSFVISNSFYNSLPITGFFDQLGVIPKQQFQTTVRDMKTMKEVIDNGSPLVIYPAGLMCEDGLSTPIPAATYKFLQWLCVDVYVARTTGTYFSMPKWAKGLRIGRTYLDVYRLFSKEELAAAELQTVKSKTNDALLFDAYREQEDLRVKYSNNDNVEGLENVLYMCPHCMTEFSVHCKDKHTLYCEACGFEQTSDKYAFLHKTSKIGEEMRYVSDWSRRIYNTLKEQIAEGKINQLSAKASIRMINYSNHKFTDVGSGEIHLSRENFRIQGVINGEETELAIPITNFASLPFSPGKHLEIQHGKDIYRCVLEDGKQVMKFINMVKIFHETNPALQK